MWCQMKLPCEHGVHVKAEVRSDKRVQQSKSDVFIVVCMQGAYECVFVDPSRWQMSMPVANLAGLRRSAAAWKLECSSRCTELALVRKYE